MVKIDGGEIYTVPVGLKVHCAWCSVVLESTAEEKVKCFIAEDSSSIYCLKHIPAPRKGAAPEAVLRESRPRRRMERSPV